MLYLQYAKPVIVTLNVLEFVKFLQWNFDSFLKLFPINVSLEDISVFS